MKTKVILLGAPVTQSFRLIGSQKQLLDDMSAAGYVFVDVTPHTKTSAHIALTVGENRFGVNDFETEGLKYLKKRQINMLEGYSYEAKYLKPKTVEHIQQHVEKALEHYFPTLTLEGFTLKIFRTNFVENLVK